MNFIFGGGAKCNSNFAFRIFLQFQALATLSENRALIWRNAKSFVQANHPNHFRCGK